MRIEVVSYDRNVILPILGVETLTHFVFIESSSGSCTSWGFPRLRRQEKWKWHQ